MDNSKLPINQIIARINDAAEMAREIISEANIFEAIIEGFNEAEGTNLKLTDITNLEAAQDWIDEFLEKYSDV
ncbi:hypothetical protein ABSDF2601 [Acinetobacter baumannii SDF]|uniref:Uncharacterized protein n=1 Tax=Acinetobacter baumannii (strain SDF) TaxID=509170 RepID=B0VTJ3_ACIBS|nr:hypothetical protein ABSDF2601 [Acinetobacter baumannii SDF]